MARKTTARKGDGLPAYQTPRWARETIRKHDELLAIRLDRIAPLPDSTEPIKIKPRPRRVVR